MPVTITLKITGSNPENSKIPSVARITGTDPKYGFSREWIRRGFSGRLAFDFFLRDGVYELREGHSRRYICIKGDQNIDVDWAVPDMLEYMRANQVDRETYYEHAWNNLSRGRDWEPARWDAEEESDTSDL